jgi:hypothetical protein
MEETVPATLTETEIDKGLRVLAKALAPYLATELQKAGLADLAPASLQADYDARTCAVFTEGLTPNVLRRAKILFQLIADDGRTDSVTLSAALNASPREIGGSLTTPIKRRAAALGLPLPWDGGRGAEPYGGLPNPRPDDDPQRTYWADRKGIAKRMLKAIEEAGGSR